MLTPNEFNVGKKEMIRKIKRECSKQGVTDSGQIAYILATVEHETNATFMPVVEAYWKSENWRKRNLRYYPFHGRGLVQITWRSNYDKFSKLVGADLVKYPDMALNPDIAVFILVYGMRKGIFTGKSLDDYINKDKVDFVGARKIINGTDKNKHIAGIAKEYHLA